MLHVLADRSVVVLSYFDEIGRLTRARVRKVKCDEGKPQCQKCSTTGRKCDGYQSRFKDAGSKFLHPKVANPESEICSSRTEITLEHIERLNHYFSTKTLGNIKLDCSKEAKEILEGSLTDPLVRSAVASLVLLRQDLETVGDDWIAQLYPTTSYHHGLEQYNLALNGLTSNLSPPTTQGLRSLLLCCHIFISIEQVRKNYAAFGQHIIQGLGIMNQARARPGFVSSYKLAPSLHTNLPHLDVFIIKLFAAPCPFSDPEPDSSAHSTPSTCPLTPDTALGSNIAPDVRSELTKIAYSILAFLDKVSKVTNLRFALILQVEKAEQLDSLERWLSRLDSLENHGTIAARPISTCFLRLFHQILKVILLWTLDHSPGLPGDIGPENEKLQSIADDIGERVVAYVTHNGVNVG